MLKDLTNQNSTTGKNKPETTPVVEQSSLQGRKSKILVLGLILIIVLVGLFSPISKAHATAYDDCVTGYTQGGTDLTTAEAMCKGKSGDPGTTPDPNKSAFKAEIDRMACFSTGEGSSVNPLSDGCIEKLFYTFFHGIASFLLWVSAYFFNVLISVSLSSDLLKSSFVGQAWGIVRDLSNIFFILILLYIAIKVILGLGGTDVKKMIARVIIIALLINFSMFFTTVIIDSSNILGLIFYNKIDTCTKDATTGKCRPYSGIGKDKDVAGGLVNSFDPTQMVGDNFFAQAKKQFNPTTGAPMADATTVPLTIMLSVILLAGAVMLFAAYCFFVSGFFFLGRLIELWILIIFSPFAFISSTVPELSSISDIGWKAWFDRLLSSAFMAPIFMFFLYFIFMLISNKSVFENIIPTSTSTDGATGVIKLILGVVLPCVLICVLLLKAKNYAKKGSGAIGEMVMKGAKIAGGMALGAAAGGTAMLGARVIGGGGGYLANKGAKFAEEHGFGRTANKLRDVSDFTRKSSFDVRGIKVAGQSLGSVTGMKVGEASKGGWNENKKQQVEKRQKRADELEKRGTGKLKNNVADAEIKLKEATLPVQLDLKLVDKEIEKAKVDLTNARNGGDEEGIKNAREALKTAQTRKTVIRENNIDKDGKPMKSIIDLEKEVREAEQKLAVEGDKIRTDYAKTISGGLSKTLNFVFKGGYSLAGADEAARKIRSGTKFDSGEKPK